MKSNSDNSMIGFSEKEADAFDIFFKNIKLSRQYQHEFTEWIPEIAYSTECAILDIFKLESLLDIIKSEKLNGPQKLTHIRNELYTMRFPQLAVVRKDWESLTRKHNPNKKNVKFKADPYFEKAGIELTINAENREELLATFLELSKIDNKIWDKIIDPFREV